MDGRGSGMGMFFVGIITGAVAGGIAALLLAPMSGKETRQMLRDRAMQTQQMTKEWVNDVKGRVSQAGQCLTSTTKSDSGKS
jgi:gas vesicle protein